MTDDKDRLPGFVKPLLFLGGGLFVAWVVSVAAFLVCWLVEVDPPTALVRACMVLMGFSVGTLLLWYDLRAIFTGVIGYSGMKFVRAEAPRRFALEAALGLLGALFFLTLGVLALFKDLG